MIMGSPNRHDCTIIREYDFAIKRSLPLHRRRLPAISLRLPGAGAHQPGGEVTLWAALRSRGATGCLLLRLEGASGPMLHSWTRPAEGGQPRRSEDVTRPHRLLLASRMRKIGANHFFIKNALLIFTGFAHGNNV
jgi:hypothetical protein